MTSGMHGIAIPYGAYWSTPFARWQGSLAHLHSLTFAAHVAKLLRILSFLDVAQSPDDLAIPSFRIHPLKGDLAGHWSIWVSGNWRITFRFNETDVELVDYQDYH